MSGSSKPESPDPFPDTSCQSRERASVLVKRPNGKTFSFWLICCQPGSSSSRRSETESCVLDPQYLLCERSHDLMLHEEERRRGGEGRKQEVTAEPQQQLGASLSPFSSALISGETPTGRLGVPKPAGNFPAHRRELPEKPAASAVTICSAHRDETPGLRRVTSAIPILLSHRVEMFIQSVKCNKFSLFFYSVWK